MISADLRADFPALLHPETQAWIKRLEARSARTGYPVDFDNFPTPKGIALRAIQGLVNTDFRPLNFLDPGAGDDGVWGEQVYRAWPNICGTAVDIRQIPAPKVNYDRFYGGTDFLAWQPEGNPYFDLIVGNPPFGIVEPWIERCQELLAPGGIICLFLRLAIMAGQKRRTRIWERFPARHVAVLSRRPSFTSNGVSDPKTEYMLVIWQRGWKGPMEWYPIDWQPLDEESQQVYNYNTPENGNGEVEE